MINQTKDLEVALVSPVCQSFQEKFLSEAEKVPGLRIVKASPVSVERAADGQPLLLTYVQNDQSQQQTFDLIVILSKPKIAPEIESLSKKLKQEVL